MAQAIRSLLLINLQSWKYTETSKPIEFSIEDLNIIRARSETGKSVIFKIFYQMCFPNYFKYGSQNKLIRRGCDEARAVYLMEDGTEITFVLGHHSQHYILRKPDGDTQTIWEQEIPEVINRELGLIYDRDLRIITNVLTKDIPYPIIATTGQWNAKMFSLVSTNEKLETAATACKEWIETFTAKTKAMEKERTIKQNIVNGLKVTDIVELEQIQTTTTKLLAISECFDVIMQKAETLITSTKEYNAVLTDMSDVVTISELRKLSQSYRVLVPLVEVIDASLRVMENVTKTEQVVMLRQLYTLSEWFRNISAEIDILRTNLQQVQESDTWLQNRSITVGTLQAFGVVKTQLTALVAGLIRLYNALNEYIQATQAWNKYNVELQALKEEMKMCPLCGHILTDTIDKVGDTDA